MTHECRKDPLSECSSDLLEAYRCLLSIHIQVKLLDFAGQEALKRKKQQRAERYTHEEQCVPRGY